MARAALRQHDEDQEAQIGGQLQHPGIVPVHDVGTHQVEHGLGGLLADDPASVRPLARGNRLLLERRTGEGFAAIRSATKISTESPSMKCSDFTNS